MKAIHSLSCLLAAAVLTLTGCDQGPCSCEPIKVPDQALLDALLEPGLDEEGELQIIDSNDDGLISFAEAEAITYLDVSDKGISDMTGIEKFINLEVLDCSKNQITKLNVTRSPALEILHCYNNRLIELGLSRNTRLETLYCIENQLTVLDISANRQLIDLFCTDNQLASLVITDHLFLRHIYCSENQLSTLDLSKCFSLWDLYVRDMPTLYEICVWELPFPPENILVDISGSPNIYFTDVCTL
jgi:Leucine-rich repeat (LRR) protein